MGKALVVTDADFGDQVLKASVPVVVDFFADWCGPCVRMAPIVEEIAAEYEGRAKVCKLDVSDSNQTATKYGIMSIPTVLVFKKGEVVTQSIGAMSKEQLKAKIDAALA